MPEREPASGPAADTLTSGLTTGELRDLVTQLTTVMHAGDQRAARRQVLAGDEPAGRPCR
jgi:hypothetical protein